MKEVRITTAVIINAAAERVYDFWSDLENFQSFIPALAQVSVIDDLHSRWVIRAPLGYEIRFDSRIVEQSPPDRLVWETRHPAGAARGELTFTGDDRRTRVDLDFRYSLKSPWLHPIARLMNRLNFPAHAFDTGLARIKRRIER